MKLEDSLSNQVRFVCYTTGNPQVDDKSRNIWSNLHEREQAQPKRATNQRRLRIMKTSSALLRNPPAPPQPSEQATNS